MIDAMIEVVAKQRNSSHKSNATQQNRITESPFAAPAGIEDLKQRKEATQANSPLYINPNARLNEVVTVIMCNYGSSRDTSTSKDPH